MHAATIVAVALVTAAGSAAWRATGGIRRPDERLSDPLTELTRQQRLHWMSLAGVVVSGWFVIVILSMEIPILVLEECQ